MSAYRQINRLLAACVLLAASLAAPVAPARELPRGTPEKAGMSAERLARMDRHIHAYVDQGRTPGVITLVARHGKIVHLDAYGPADVASGRKIATDDLFRLYSMTKPLTSVALLMLYEEGRFQLTDPLSKYFPAFADVKVFAGTGPGGSLLLDAPKRPVTIQDVFRHTAGFTYGVFDATPVDLAYQKANPLEKNLIDFMEKLAKLPLLYQPGERWVYSVAHDVQAALVEKLSGQPFDAFVRARIFEPLGMTGAVFKVPADRKARVPTMYVSGPDGRLAATPSSAALGGEYGDTVFGGYSASATIHDYARFAQMLLNKGELDGVRLLSPKTVALMGTNHLGESALASGAASFLSPGTGYGLGVSVLMDPAARGNVGSAGEFGWSGIASTHFLVDPAEDLVAIYFTQLYYGDLALRSEFVTLLYQSITGP